MYLNVCFKCKYLPSIGNFFKKKKKKQMKNRGFI